MSSRPEHSHAMPSLSYDADFHFSFCRTCGRAFGCPTCYIAHLSQYDLAHLVPRCGSPRVAKAELYLRGLFVPKVSLERTCTHTRPSESFVTNNGAHRILKWLNFCRGALFIAARQQPQLKYGLQHLLPLLAGPYNVDLLVALINPFLGMATFPVLFEPLRSTIEQRAYRCRSKKFCCVGGTLDYVCYRTPQTYCPGCQVARCRSHDTASRCRYCYCHILTISCRGNMMCLSCGDIFTEIGQARAHVDSMHSVITA